MALEAPHLSIGEVLALLQEEFPDITISKIRFLESQGLLDPDRTPSGYRKFFDADIERLRWILRQQREHFLPLKVIKDRLAEAGDAVPSDESDGVDPHAPAVELELVGEEPRTDAGDDSADDADGPEAEGSGAPAGRSRRSRKPSGRNPLDSGPTEVSMTVDELARATGLTARQLGELTRYGLMSSRTVAGTTYYDGDALIVANVAAAFLDHGVEARHLRMYKVAAEREAGLFEQVIMPLLKQRSGEHRARARADLGDLAALGEDLRAAMLREALRDHIA